MFAHSILSYSVTTRILHVLKKSIGKKCEIVQPSNFQQLVMLFRDCEKILTYLHLTLER